MTSAPRSRFVYVIHIRTTPEKLWAGLTQPEFTRRYWCETWQESDWTPGASWRAMIPDGRIADSGTIIESDPPVALSSESATTKESRTPKWRPGRLVLTWENQFLPELKAEGHSKLTYEIEPQEGGSVKLTLTHEMDRPNSKLIEATSGGWPPLLSSLKSLLETGEPLIETTKWPKDM